MFISKVILSFWLLHSLVFFSDSNFPHPLIQLSTSYIRICFPPFQHSVAFDSFLLNILSSVSSHLSPLCPCFFIQNFKNWYSTRFHKAEIKVSSSFSSRNWFFSKLIHVVGIIQFLEVVGIGYCFLDICLGLFTVPRIHS